MRALAGFLVFVFIASNVAFHVATWELPMRLSITTEWELYIAIVISGFGSFLAVMKIQSGS